MKSMQRKFGGLMRRSADEQDVGAVIAEFKAVDEMLDRLIKDLKAYRHSWEDILRFQYNCSEALANLYKSIEGAPKPGEVDVVGRREPTVTPQRYMQKCLGLQKVYSELRADLFANEINMIEKRLQAPAQEAKNAVKPLQKTPKHRENMKLDYERYLSRAEHARKKETRTVKEEVALQQHEANLAQARIDYQTADEQVKQTFPPVTEAVISLLPYILHSQIQLQTTLVGQVYTVIDRYTKAYQLANPPPGDAEIIAAWEKEFTGFRKELEQGVSMIAHGKAVHQPMALQEKGSTITGLGLRNKVMHRTPSSQGLGGTVYSKSGRGSRQSSTSLQSSQPIWDQDEEEAPQKPPRPGGAVPSGSKPRIPSAPGTPFDQKSTASFPTPGPAASWSRISIPSSGAPPSYEEAFDAASRAGGVETPSRYHTPTNGPSPKSSNILPTYTHANPSNTSYFSTTDEKRRPSFTSQASQSSIASAAAMAAGKKKPPPPVPAKRLPSQTAQYVTAVYDFEGQSEGDLAFREGEKIRVVKKTDSTDDWWEGEIGGKRGAFPANYVQL
ncbi:SH3 domain signaling protein [Teratosphaeria destructans]|uniref:SH3 domain signaling protein n=1 Tax=Teratosphaeria destructans TaxID=418781 RepID=A0A9W7W1L8_9PEZI|nr:SH3 domain signaling protein [Teratosphaeria destructans]